MTRSLAILLAIALAAGCGGEGDATAASPRPAPASAATPGDEPGAPPGATVLAGRVRFDGTPPARAVLDAGSCLPGVETLDESVIVDAGGTLRNVVVWIAEGRPAGDAPVPTEAVRLDQKAGAFVPHVLAVRAGQPVRVTNSDPVRHNYRITTFLNEGGNVTQPPGGEDVKVFDQPELPVLVQCDVHRWMECHVAVFDHPWFAVTGEGGTFRFEGLPAGKYRLETWHEVWSDPQALEVELVAGRTTEVEFVFRR